MKKFTQVYEAKFFTPDPSIIKKYAARIIPLYITGEIKTKETKLIDEWLEMNKNSEMHKNENIICDLEIMAIKNIFDSPLGSSGYSQLVADIDSGCPRLERFLRPYYFKKF
jgi:hypothetical protein